MAEKILIVDDEKDMLALLQRIISERTAYEVMVTDDPLRVPDLLKKTDFDLVITDLKMPGQDGIKVLETVKQTSHGTAVVVMTAYGTIETAIEATRKGAFDYVTKPLRKERMLHVIDQAMKWQRLQKENSYLRKELEDSSLFPSLIGKSPAMRNLHSQIDRVAGTSATILITGESGTGKELAARAIHCHSTRKNRIFIPVNCSALPESIIESELFGHLRGSFTGATRDSKGLVEEADRGTLFLDEIGDLSISMQVKLLRLLQEGEYKVIGSNAIRKVDIRFIAATNQVLPEMIRKGEFREDLFYRLNVINIHLPPLRERLEDIPLLVQHFLRKYNSLHLKNVRQMSEEAVDCLLRREWPGNVRELENVIERGVIMAGDDTLRLDDVAAPDRRTHPGAVPLSTSGDIFSMPFKEAKDKLIEEFQTQYITRVLARHAGNVSRAARESGLKRQYLHRLMRDTNVESRDFKKSDPSE